MNWSNTVKKSGPKSLHNDVRDWQSHTGNHYFKLFLLKAVLQAAESRGVLLFRLCKRAVFIKFSIVCKIFVCCLCAQSAVMLQPHANNALWGDSSGSGWCVPVQSGDHLPFSHRFHSAGVYAVRLQVTHHSFPLRCRLSLYRCHRLHLHLGSEAYIELSRFVSHFSFFLSAHQALRLWYLQVFAWERLHQLTDFLMLSLVQMRVDTFLSGKHKCDDKKSNLTIKTAEFCFGFLFGCSRLRSVLMLLESVIQTELMTSVGLCSIGTTWPVSVSTDNRWDKRKFKDSSVCFCCPLQTEKTAWITQNKT